MALTPVSPVLLKKVQFDTEPVILPWKTAPPSVLPELLLNWQPLMTLVESAWETAPPERPAVLKAKLLPVMLDWLPESTKMPPPADQALEDRFLLIL